jgi:hypothetical protein
MTKPIRDVFSLVHEAAANRTGVDLDESDDVGILATHELRDVI